MIKKITLLSLLCITTVSYANCRLIDHVTEQFIANNHLTGAAIALVRGKHITYCNYGYSDLEHHHKVTQNTLFDIASITKTVTATIAAIAYLDGKYDLYKPITHYVPALTNPYYNKVTGIHLLTHTANIPLNFPVTTTESDLMRSLNALPFSTMTQPGVFYVYSNPGIALVGIALQHVYHHSYQEIAQTLLLNKLDMHDTFTNVPTTFKGLVAEEFDQNNKPTPSYDAGALVAAGGLKSTTHDLAKYLMYQMNSSSDKTLNKALALTHDNYYCVANHRYQELAWQYRPEQDLTVQHFNDKESTIKKAITTQCKLTDGFFEKTGSTSYIIYSRTHKVGMVILLNKSLVGDRVVLGRTIITILESSKS